MLSVETEKGQRTVQLGVCPECGNRDLVTDKDSGEVVCIKCGLVIRDLIFDQKPEWRSFTLEEERTRRRVGSPTSLSRSDKGFSTTFRLNVDAFGKSLPLETRLRMRRLKRWDVRARMYSSSARNLSQSMSELYRLSDKLNIPEAVREEAALIYRKALKNGLISGRSIAAMAAASLYAACRITNTPRRLDDVVKVSTKDRKEISRSYRLLQKELSLRMPLDDPMKYVAKIASKLSLSQTTQNTAIDILRRADKVKEISGKGPTGIAAAALYIASIIEGEKTTQRDLAEVSGVTEVTIRNRYRGLVESLDIDV